MASLFRLQEGPGKAVACSESIALPNMKYLCICQIITFSISTTVAFEFQVSTFFIMSFSHGVSSFHDKDKIFEGSANTLKHRYKYERLHMYIHYTHLKGASYYAFIWYRHAMHPLYLVFV